MSAQTRCTCGCPSPQTEAGSPPTHCPTCGRQRTIDPALEAKQTPSQSANGATREFVVSSPTPDLPGSEAVTRDTTGPAGSSRLLGDFGDYELLGEINRGGMGVVFRARQKSLNRIVALKMILAGQFASEEQVRRFHQEAEEAGRLDHPNIVPIYQVGELNGQHYYSMKLIEGGSLVGRVRQFLDDPRAAVGLMAAVARAVHYAHQHAVLHRDIKPGNILLDEVGQPHVADFGLAKHLGSEGGTLSGAVLGTPGYMAPEQAAGRRDVSVAADVHGLGAVLYELLTGRVPFTGESQMEALLSVLERDPPAPRSVNRAIPEDLETICLKCLRKEPEQRYASARDLADDLQRFLDGEAIQARRVALFERAVKWARRRPAPAALLAVTVLAILALTVGGWWSNARLSAALAESEANAREAREERERAAVTFQKNLETIDDLVINLDSRLAHIRNLDQIASSQEMEPIRLEFLREFLAIVEKLQQENTNDPLARRQRGWVWARLGDVSFQKGDYSRGDHSFRQASQIQESLAQEFPSQPRYRIDLALTHAQHARVLLGRGQRPDARAALKKAFEISDRLAGDFPENSEYRVEAERYRFEFGNLLEEAGKTAEAQAAYVQALDRIEKLVTPAPSAPLHNLVGLIADSVGSLLAANEPVESVRMFEYSLEARRKAWKLSPDLLAYQQDLRSAYMVLGEALTKQGKHTSVAELADRFVADTPDPRIDLYNCSCLMAQAVRAADGIKADQKKLADGYAERAVTLLEKATLAGYASARDERDHMDRDSDLDPLRHRPDYQALLTRLDSSLLPVPLAPAQEVNLLTKEYNDAQRKYDLIHGKAVTVAQKARARTRTSPVEAYGKRFLELAEKYKDSSAAPVALAWILNKTMPTGKTPLPIPVQKLRVRALEVIQRDQLTQTNLAEVCRLLGFAAEPRSDRVLIVLHEKHGQEKIRGVASMALAISRARQGQKCRSTDPLLSRALTRQAEAQFEEVIARFKGVRLGKTTMGEVAGKWLRDLRYLDVGSVAQEIEGQDLDGNTFKLSEHRGKVVVLDFWANWCGYCRAEYEPAKALVKRLEGRPFAYLGINCDEDREVVRRVVRRAGLNWRSWYDGGREGGRIRRQWQVNRFPTIYVLDGKGVIRFKDVRGKKLEEAVDRLLKEQSNQERPMTAPSTQAPDVTTRFIGDIRRRIGEVIVGQDVVVERVLIALFTGGHLLLQGVPGLAKTLLVATLARTVDLSFARIQFTIDLLPSDILGSEILDQRLQDFRTVQGPIFTNLLLADEINRAAPRVQSALLEAMQERKVTIAKVTWKLPAPFLVIATQNPVEQSGTFELPEAQLDRFMLCHRLDYPRPEEEREVLRRNMALGVRREDKGAIARTEFDVLEGGPVGSTEQIVAAMEAVHAIHVSDVFLEHVLEVVARTRRHKSVEFGASPRAGIALIKSSRARALIHGRGYVVPDDLFALAEDVLLHRMRLNYEALAEGRTPQSVLQEILTVERMKEGR